MPLMAVVQAGMLAVIMLLVISLMLVAFRE
jgi:hypothetical protein